jgi:hypothetical protein
MSRASSLSSQQPKKKGQEHEAEWWKEAAQSFSPSKITSGSCNNSINETTASNNNYGSIAAATSAPLSYVTSPNRYTDKSTANDDDNNNGFSLLDHAAAMINNNNQRGGGGSFDQDDIVQSSGAALSDISNDSSSSESDNDYSSYDSDDDDHSLEQPHRTLGLIFFDFIRFIALSANIRFFNTELMPVLMNWKNMDILNKCLRVFMASSAILLIAVEFPDLFPFLHHHHDTTTSVNNNNSSTQTTAAAGGATPPLYFSNWIPRGIFYLFLSLIMFEQQLVVEFIDDKRHASKSSRFFDGIFMVISASIMLLVGLIYILLGMFCMQRVMERVRREEKARWDEYWIKLKKLEEEEDLEEEREWLLENGGGGGDSEHGVTVASNAGIMGYKERWRKWRKRFRRRYRRGRGWYRTIDFRC